MKKKDQQQEIPNETMQADPQSTSQIQQDVPENQTKKEPLEYKPVHSIDDEPGFTKPDRKSKYAPMSTLGIMLSILLMAIPIIGWVIAIFWAVGGCRKVAKRRLARAFIIYALIFALILFAVNFFGITGDDCINFINNTFNTDINQKIDQLPDWCKGVMSLIMLNKDNTSGGQVIDKELSDINDQIIREYTQDEKVIKAYKYLINQNTAKLQSMGMTEEQITKAQDLYENDTAKKLVEYLESISSGLKG